MFNNGIRTMAKHHPRSYTYPQQFLKALRSRLESAERAQAANVRAWKLRRAAREAR